MKKLFSHWLAHHCGRWVKENPHLNGVYAQNIIKGGLYCVR